MMIRRFLTLLVAVGAFAACDDATGPEGQGNLSIAFATTAPPTTAAGAGLTAFPATARSIAVAGSNGTLTIDQIYVVVAEFELEGALASCDAEGSGDGDFDDDDCEEFESQPALLQIPTDGTALEVVNDQVPLGSYTALEWSVEDIDDDEDDEDQQDLQLVRSDIEAVFGPGAWPGQASMAVVGTFLADGATEAVPFTTFFDAEIEVELELVPPLEITAAGVSRSLTIILAPELWFTNSDGTVMNLAQLSGELVEFEAEFENGVTEIEREDDEDDD